MRKRRASNQGVQRDPEGVVAEDRTVDGPFVTTIDELGLEARREFGMPHEFLLHLMAVIVSGMKEILVRKDEEELARLAVRMYYAGLLQGARWCKEKVERETL